MSEFVPTPGQAVDLICRAIEMSNESDVLSYMKASAAYSPSWAEFMDGLEEYLRGISEGQPWSRRNG